jgi:hypothetical protein
MDRDSHTDELTMLVERIQFRALTQGGFDPSTFSRRLDAQEITPLKLLAMRAAVAWLRLRGRKHDAGVLSGMLAYVARVSPDLARFEETKASFHRKFEQPRSKYQREDDHILLMLIRDAILQALAELPESDSLGGLVKTIRVTTLATAPIGRCNAEIRKCRRSDRFAIILDDEVGRAASQMGLIYAAIAGENDGRVVLDSLQAVANLNEAGAAVQSYRSMVQAFVCDGSTRIAIPMLPENEFATRVMSTFAQLSLVFVLAHEYAHAHLGHLRRPFDSTAKDDDAADAAFGIAEETQADLLAMEVTEVVCRNWGCNPSLAFAGAAAVLCLYASAYDSIGSMHRCGAGTSTYADAIRKATRHPSPSDRLHQLLAHQPAATWAFHVVRCLQQIGTQTCSGKPHPRWAALEAAFAA